MTTQLRMAFLSGLLAALVGGNDALAAVGGAAAVGADGPGGGELAPVLPKGAEQEIESGVEIVPEVADGTPKAVTFRGCISPGARLSYSIRLPGGGSFLHRVVPDRRGFNVVMTIDYPGLDRRVNRFGPGRAEAFTVRTPFGRTQGRVRISGVGGSFGCFTLRVTP